MKNRNKYISSSFSAILCLVFMLLGNNLLHAQNEKKPLLQPVKKVQLKKYKPGTKQMKSPITFAKPAASHKLNVGHRAPKGDVAAGKARMQPVKQVREEKPAKIYRSPKKGN